MSRCHIILLAAGASTRMRGSDKLLREVDGTPLLLRQARAALRACASVTITLPEGDKTRGVWLSDLPVRIAHVGAQAMSASIRAGVEATPPGDVLVMLADMPEIGVEDLEAMLEAGQGSSKILRAATRDGTPGHPVYFPAACRPQLDSLHGDQGARSLLGSKDFEILCLAGDRARLDLDTPEDWEAWERSRSPG